MGESDWELEFRKGEIQEQLSKCNSFGRGQIGAGPVQSVGLGWTGLLEQGQSVSEGLGWVIDDLGGREERADSQTVF